MAQYSIKDALNKMLEQSHWKDQYLATKIKMDWETLMGKTVARHTSDLVIKNRILYIHSSVAALKNELSYNRKLLMEKINQHLGENYLTDVVIC